MSVALQPSVWLEFRLEQYPSGTTTTYRWSTRPLADSGAWKEGRIVKGGFGDIKRSLSSLSGDYEISSVSVMLKDDDGTLRSLLAGVTTQFFTNREGAFKCLSEAGRAVGTTAMLWFRGRVGDYQLQPGRMVSMEFVEWLGSEGSPFYLDKELGVFLGDEHTNLPDASRGLMYPMYAGEQSDNGAVDATGANAEKGLCPGIDSGDYDIDPTPTSTPPSYLPAPSNVQATVVGTPGSTTYTYAISTGNAYGESPLSTVVQVTNGPNTLDASNYIRLTWDNVTGATFFRVWGRTANPPNKWLDGMNNGGTYVNPETEYHDDHDQDIEKDGPTLGATSTAVASDTVWGRLVVALGCYEVLSVYGSDLAAGGEATRVKLDASLDGVEYIIPSSATWPHANPYLELTDPISGDTIRMTVIYVRGPRLNAHRDGSVTIAVNLCGPDDVGDGSGDDIEEAYPQLQWFLNTHVLYNNGKGYRSGNWPALVTYANGDAMIKTSSITAAQAITAAWIGGVGYKGHIALTEPITVREFLRRFFVTFSALGGDSRHGQILAVAIDDDASPTAGRLYRDRIEIAELESVEFAHDLVQTAVDYVYDWDADAQKFRREEQQIEDTAATAALKLKKTGQLREMYFTRDPATANDSAARYLALVKRAPRYVTFRTDLGGVHTDLGDQFRFTHYDGLEDDATPMLTVRHVIHPNNPESVSLTGLDLGRLLSAGFPLLQDEGSMVGNLGDETSAADPPAGAYELR